MPSPEVQKLINRVVNLEMKLQGAEKECVTRGAEILQLKEKTNRQGSQAPSLCPKASDVDCQLASMYMNLWIGFNADVREGDERGNGGPLEATGPQYRQDCSDIAHAEAMRLVKKFREEILDDKKHDAHDAHDDISPSRDGLQD